MLQQRALHQTNICKTLIGRTKSLYSQSTKSRHLVTGCDTLHAVTNDEGETTGKTNGEINGLTYKSDKVPNTIDPMSNPAIPTVEMSCLIALIY